jgi:hypothetical protein
MDTGKPLLGVQPRAGPDRTAALRQRFSGRRSGRGVDRRGEPAGARLGLVLAAVWSIGAASVGSWFLVQAISTMLLFRGRRPVTDETVLAVLEDCKEELRIHVYLGVIETPHVHAPALFGWIRPRLLVPAGMLSALSRRELRHVFLHELSHLKRHDIVFNWLTALAQVLHWFNPAVWLAARQAHADMELACDELALSHLEDQGYRDYGVTIIKLLDASGRQGDASRRCGDRSRSETDESAGCRRMRASLGRSAFLRPIGPLAGGVREGS